MRLLHDDGLGGFSLAQFYGKDVPPYAILSHTWGSDDDEVSFQDVIKKQGIDKSGYTKLRFCSRQAHAHGLKYFWVDTCCINKFSDQELSESINSMFRWYQRAEVCIVFLSDVEAHGAASVKTSFQNSRWFTRGWTLQELLAPAIVEFYDADSIYLGNKNYLAEWIESITKISLLALEHTPLEWFSVQDRLLWARHRETKREEDAAYSLLGIFDVSMPLIYGEGRERAYTRLLREVEAGENTKMIVQKYRRYLKPAEAPRLRYGIERIAASTDLVRKPLHGRERVSYDGEPVWSSSGEPGRALNRSTPFEGVAPYAQEFSEYEWTRAQDQALSVRPRFRQGRPRSNAISIHRRDV